MGEMCGEGGDTGSSREICCGGEFPPFQWMGPVEMEQRQLQFLRPDAFLSLKQLVNSRRYH